VCDVLQGSSSSCCTTGGGSDIFSHIASTIARIIKKCAYLLPIRDTSRPSTLPETREYVHAKDACMQLPIHAWPVLPVHAVLFMASFAHVRAGCRCSYGRRLGARRPGSATQESVCRVPDSGADKRLEHDPWTLGCWRCMIGGWRRHHCDVIDCAHGHSCSPIGLHMARMEVDSRSQGGPPSLSLFGCICHRLSSGLLRRAVCGLDVDGNCVCFVRCDQTH
jgi:hypothetical protein